MKKKTIYLKISLLAEDCPFFVVHLSRFIARTREESILACKKEGQRPNSIRSNGLRDVPIRDGNTHSLQTSVVSLLLLVKNACGIRTFKAQKLH